MADYNSKTPYLNVVNWWSIFRTIFFAVNRNNNNKQYKLPHLSCYWGADGLTFFKVFMLSIVFIMSLIYSTLSYVATLCWTVNKIIKKEYNNTNITFKNLSSISNSNNLFMACMSVGSCLPAESLFNNLI